MADFHVVAAEDAQGTAVLIVVEGRLAKLEAAVVEFGLSGFFQSDAVPAAASYVKNMKSRGVGHGEEDGVRGRANGIQSGVVIDADAIKTIEKHCCPSHDLECVFNDDVISDENSVGFPCPRLWPRNLYGLAAC